ncbi:bifunctional biotin--[acetyl-CoA-carboxylase] ligase/biotin operon repressor BirA [Streptococcus panodentis]|uniref:Bifunctional ligase/repressor BirA n=1 Tax=Streptococcus panodentis TaxID=1581472 RepID=A0ABS5ATG4_9STRE|nr:bifunctional biotin--[acetyl-CoA-carboxylase] ligase/biotin operon repressor BirA [Streptococcus panodentis]MBP2619770.1 bifunctional biotin--[acetyl-CoA-carboxylase] synthetase/biotin operon repressor [Streptococcus panodentis]
MKTYEKLFQILHQADDYVNGEQIAQDLGISRTSVWKAIQTLEKEGVVIESVKNRGYRLKAGDLLIPQWIEQEAPIAVSFNPDCQSTQMDAKAGIEAGAAADTLYLAAAQSAGRGRFGRAFFCPKQGGFYMSLHLRPDLPFDQLPSYTILTAGAVYKAVKNLCLIDVDIKWVNDIYYKNKKIAGILTEATTSVETGLVTDVIIGVGFNFSIHDFPEDIKEKAGSLFEQEPPISRNELIAEIWNCFYESDPEELFYLYKQHSLVLGRQVTFSQKKTDCTGLAKDISSSGQLLVQLADGQEIWLSSGEISLTSW